MNDKILNDAQWEGFQGDSEYINGLDETVMGYWTFIRTITNEDVPDGERIYCLDDAIWNYGLLCNKELAIMNDNGQLCRVKFNYPAEDFLMGDIC